MIWKPKKTMILLRLSAFFCFWSIGKYQKMKDVSAKTYGFEVPNHQKTMIFLVLLSKTYVFDLKDLKDLNDSWGLRPPDPEFGSWPNRMWWSGGLLNKETYASIRKANIVKKRANILVRTTNISISKANILHSEGKPIFK